MRLIAVCDFEACTGARRYGMKKGQRFDGPAIDGERLARQGLVAEEKPRATRKEKTDD
ncbi:hypothetical protein [Adlercreutzia muris]|jgi:hypothetical protein|uniref:hypothetical protein n=1 Tax=Adlercreutzia muris TaxID=1796610 RepID=UPI0014796393|nr:hypothetical protein [Adlercreutzia muris]MCR2027445.1 hypothetical protein [Adlercreutzia muris]